MIKPKRTFQKSLQGGDGSKEAAVTPLNNKENNMDNLQAQSGPSVERTSLGKCEYKPCNRDALYKVDFGCDDMTAILCNEHHDMMLALVGLPDCEGE
jgi:hypothetical protein